MHHTLAPYFFNIMKGDKTLSTTEISEETYVKLKTPTFVILVSGIVTMTFSIAFIIFGIKNNESAIQERLTIADYKIDRRIDSISATRYRENMEFKMNIALHKLDLLMQKNKLGSFETE